MYTYSIPNEDDSAEIIHGFVSGGYTQLPRQSVPAPGSGLLGSTAKVWACMACLPGTGA